jgi:hypothetical protein
MMKKKIKEKYFLMSKNDIKTKIYQTLLFVTDKNKYKSKSSGNRFQRFSTITKAAGTILKYY